MAEALSSEPNLRPQTRQALSELVNALQDERKSASVAPTEREPATATRQPPEGLRSPSVLDRLKIYGDIRFRHESTFLDSDSDRHRERIRLRIGADLDLSDQLTIGTRLTTGDPEDPRSPYETIGDGFRKFDISFDRLFATYKPEWFEGSFATIGKFGHSFVANPIYGELVWDADVQPEGAAFGYRRAKVAWFDEIRLTAGVYNFLERGAGTDAFTWVAQASGTVPIGDELALTASIGYYHFTNPTPGGSTRILDDNRGNATVDASGDAIPDAFASDFGIVNPIVALQCKSFALPLTFTGEYILNTRADIDDDTGWALGAALGQAKKKGDWQVYYQYQVIERDAIFTPVSQDDFVHATNFKGHIVGARYRFADWMDVNLFALISQPEESTAGAPDDDDIRLRADLTISF